MISLCAAYCAVFGSRIVMQESKVGPLLPYPSKAEGSRISIDWPTIFWASELRWSEYAAKGCEFTPGLLRSYVGMPVVSTSRNRGHSASNKATKNCSRDLKIQERSIEKPETAVVPLV